MVRLDSPRVALGAAAALAFLLVVLATLQYRWLDQVADAERDRAKASLAAAAYGFAAEFDREVGHAIACFEPWPDAQEPARDWFVSSWQRCARSGVQNLVGDAYLAEGTGGDFALTRLGPAGDRLETISWPPELSAVRERLAKRAEASPEDAPRFSPIDPDVPALIVFDRRLFRYRQISPSGLNRFVILRLDLADLKRNLFPELTRRYFGSGNLQDYDLAVFRRGDPSRPIYVSGPGARITAGGSDATADLLTFRMFSEQRRSEAGRRPPASPDARVDPGEGPPPPPPGPHAGWRPRPRAVGERRPAGGWRLVVAHRDGSLDAAVARARRRNLAVGLGILGVLAGAIAITVASARRAQRLARQQIDFVASVSHELHTPLAAIRSAGQNLADGVVNGDEQVRRYGSLIANEGRRLSEMVASVLDFAGIQSGRRHYRMRPVRVETIVDGALAQCSLAAEQRGIRVEKDVADDLPPILADAEALGRALRNLMENAIKYGGSERWMRVRAESVPDGSRPEVAILVEDRGPGVREADRSRIFEPFYRGEDSSSTGATGSGLGLALVRPIVEAHGGSVTVESNGGSSGARFVVRLPAASAAAADEGSAW
jgi:signal transduction histidine kinase